MNYLGIDISKAELVCCKLSEGGNEREVFSNDGQGIQALLDWLGDAEVHIVMEATGVYWQASAYALYERGFKVSVVNPAQLKYYARSLLRRAKTDALDAELLARYAQERQPAAWKPASASYEELKLLVRERDDVVAQLGQLRNQRHAHQHRQSCPAMLLELLTERSSLLEQQVKSLEQAIEALCQSHFKEAYRSLRSIPGVGLISAAVLLAETAGLADFQHPKQLTAYAGIAPAPNQSGASKRHSPISKIGNPRLRTAFYMVALQARRQAPFKDFYDRLISKGKAKKVVLIALARKLLVIAFTLVKSNQLFDPLYLPNPLPLPSP
jgi:transposase